MLKNISCLDDIIHAWEILNDDFVVIDSFTANTDKGLSVLRVAVNRTQKLMVYEYIQKGKQQSFVVSKMVTLDSSVDLYTDEPE